MVRNRNTDDCKRATHAGHYRIVGEHGQHVVRCAGVHGKIIVAGDAQAVIHHDILESVVIDFALLQPVESHARVEGETAVSAHRHRRTTVGAGVAVSISVHGERNHAE